MLEFWKEFISLDFAWWGEMMQKKWLRQLGAAILIPSAEYASTSPSWTQKEIPPPPYLPPIQGRCRRRLKRVTFSFLFFFCCGQTWWINKYSLGLQQEVWTWFYTLGIRTFGLVALSPNRKEGTASAIYINSSKLSLCSASGPIRV